MMTANYSRKWMMAGLLAFSAFTSPVMAQHNGLVDMSHSKEARMVNMPLGSTRWTGGFWGGRFKVFSETSLWDMWKTCRRNSGKYEKYRLYLFENAVCSF